MEQFAAVSGISRPTLSKYFQDPESVRASTRLKIEDALQRFDYRPNIYAMNQNRRLTKNIGIVVPYLADPFFAEIARNLERRCIDAGYWPTLFSAHGDRQLECDIMDALRSLKPAGVLFAPLGRASDQAEVERFCNEVPAVLFDSLNEGLGYTFVGSDNQQFMFQMVEYLCRTGAPPCLFEMKTPPNPNSNKRRNGYHAAMEGQGNPPTVFSVPGEGWGLEEIGYREGLRVLRGELPSDTILCSNDRLAIGLLAAAYELGLTVGHGAGTDIRIAGLDDHPFSRFTCPALTTVAHDYTAVSEESVRRLLQAIDSADSSAQEPAILFEGRLVMRASA
ncbi:LacI family DNA-binding transcriptional regulator [Psychromarinibacter sp. C21-152]|uniref:LacI family DNA-binding transcriptional regulator n=1 Tax=Psychromarinibacter sediminicola TaxID=3033385 RepID=A0AAE3T8E6_9RHOB|nr:LacI family DNA-binding transcriptional regulator [Psychromarinibacter sediminicola]MDF0600623.1 LacI family DNA-binding transcriptional regulator [Psychromarinibacter sediminicola]